MALPTCVVCCSPPLDCTICNAHRNRIQPHQVWHRRMLDWLDTHKARIGAQQANNAALLAAERAAAAPAAAKAPAAVAATVAVAAPAGPEEDAAAVVLVNGGSEGPRSGDGIAGLATGLGAVKLGAGAEGGCDLRTVRDTMVTAP